MLSRLARLLGRTPRVDPVPGPTAVVSVYEREGRHFVQHSNRTKQEIAGYWIASGDVESIEQHVDDQAIGAAVLRALARCELEVDVPPRDAKLEAPLFRAMGVRSRKASMQGTRSVGVTREDGVLRIEPARNGGSSGPERGYHPIPQQAITLPRDSDAASVGAAVRTALAHATAA